ncbi:MAG: hypothetical protein DCC49_08100 [Acidobacteria bacterium]|nr:MAG: hypothetical protein DCC49_08100 [Acidobacteriota bacterium]
MVGPAAVVEEVRQLVDLATVAYMPDAHVRIRRDSEVSERICRAAITCFERFGVRKTSLEDIAGEAQCSRATIYRYFEGKDSIVLETLRREAVSFFSILADRLETVDTFEELFAEAATTSAEVIGNHRLLNVMIEVEPQLLLPHVAFGPSNAVEIASTFLAPYMARLRDSGDIGDVDVERASEWIVRTVLSYLLTPSRTLDLSDRQQVTELARCYLRPALGCGAPINNE